MSLARLISLSVQERRGIFTPEKGHRAGGLSNIDEEYVPWIKRRLKANNEIRVDALIQIKARIGQSALIRSARRIFDATRSAQ
jgi:hypothetical protein